MIRRLIAEFPSEIKERNGNNQQPMVCDAAPKEINLMELRNKLSKLYSVYYILHLLHIKFVTHVQLSVTSKL